MKKWMLAAAIAFLGLTATQARADGVPQKVYGPFGNAHGQPSGVGRTLPVFQAAPWYLYWPYDAHFLTPAPIYGAFYAPPMMGNYPVQPYFPMPQWVPPAGYAPPVAQPPAPTSPAPPVGK